MAQSLGMVHSIYVRATVCRVQGLVAVNVPLIGDRWRGVFAWDGNSAARSIEVRANPHVLSANEADGEVRVVRGGWCTHCGPRGAKQTVSTCGNRTTIGVPGTALSYTVFNPSSKALTATTSTWPSMGFLQGVIASFAELVLTARDDVRIRRAVELSVGIERMTRRFTPLCCTTVG